MEVVAFLRRPSADSLARHSLRVANAGEESGLHGSSRCHAGPRHRRKYRDIQLGECSDVGGAAGAASGAIGGAALVSARMAAKYGDEQLRRLRQPESGQARAKLWRMLAFLSDVQGDPG